MRLFPPFFYLFRYLHVGAILFPLSLMINLSKVRLYKCAHSYFFYTHHNSNRWTKYLGCRNYGLSSVWSIAYWINRYSKKLWEIEHDLQSKKSVKLHHPEAGHFHKTELRHHSLVSNSTLTWKQLCVYQADPTDKIQIKIHRCVLPKYLIASFICR